MLKQSLRCVPIGFFVGGFCRHMTHLQCLCTNSKIFENATGWPQVQCAHSPWDVLQLEASQNTADMCQSFELVTNPQGERYFHNQIKTKEKNTHTYTSSYTYLQQ